MNDASNVQIEESWKSLLKEEFSKEYFQNIKHFLRQELASGKQVFPPGPKIFNALNSCPVSKVRIVLLGQDPYHNIGQAHGLSFSVEHGVQIPPSLLNMYKELEVDIGMQRPTHGHLQSWADQGVLLLNASLTVEAHQANSHSKIGWHDFTDSIIQKVALKQENLVFLLWGSFARKKKTLIQGDHLILEAPHPSPLSAHRGFFGCKHFSKANAWLEGKGLSTIDWNSVNQEKG